MHVMSTVGHKKVACIVLVTWLLFLHCVAAVTTDKDSITDDDSTSFLDDWNVIFSGEGGRSILWINFVDYRLIFWLVLKQFLFSGAHFLLPHLLTECPHELSLSVVTAEIRSVNVNSPLRGDRVPDKKCRRRSHVFGFLSRDPDGR